MALRTESPDEWVIFFEESGIPNETAINYAKIFTENSLTGEELPDLDMGLLKSVGITSVGHALKILRHAKADDVKPEVPTGSSPAYKPLAAAAKLPEITPEMTHPQFRKLRTDWSVYKQITCLPTQHFANHLYSACSSEVQTSLISTHTDWASLSEEDLLDAGEGDGETATKRRQPDRWARKPLASGIN